jgi:hypothetical protein
MSASTDPGTDVARLAPPPPGTVVWSILSWPELLADFGWLEGRWAPLDGRAHADAVAAAASTGASNTAHANTRDRHLPDVRGSLLVGLRPGLPRDASKPQPATAIAETGSLAKATLDPASGVQLATLHAFVIL